MKDEVLAAVTFFVQFIEKSDTFPRDQLENFKMYLTDLLIERFDKHWFPELPSKGQGYRCIRINGSSPVDITLELAASKCGFRYKDLRLPTELTVWVDPSEVCYRLGESEGSYCTLASFPSESSTSSETSSSSSSTANSPTTMPSQNNKAKKMQRQTYQRHHLEAHHKIRQPPVAFSSLRMKPSSREMNFNYQSRPNYRCDGPPYVYAPAFYKNTNYNRSINRSTRIF